MAVMSPAAWLIAAALVLQAPAQPSLEGIWEGPVNSFAGKLTIRIHVKKTPDGKLEVKMDVPEQGAAGIPVPVSSFEAGVFKWEIPTIKAQYEGRLKEGGREIEGTFTQISPQPLTLKKLDKAPAGPNRPQEPKPPFPYLTEEVAFPSTAEGVMMAGTLTMPPSGSGKHPAVILISGSGPQDRDEQLMGHKPFLILADYLSRRGFAVLRYDDRGFGKSTGRFSGSTTTRLFPRCGGRTELSRNALRDRRQKDRVHRPQRGRDYRADGGGSPAGGRISRADGRNGRAGERRDGAAGEGDPEGRGHCRQDN